MPYAAPAARAAYMRAYKDATRVSQRANRRMYDRAKHANQRARLYGVEGTLLTAEVRAVMAVGACHYCGSSTRLGIDHVIPMCDGGINRPENLVCACHSCNASKWRGSEPGRWSRSHDCCAVCEATENPYLANGMCTKCYRRVRSARLRADLRVHTAVQPGRGASHGPTGVDRDRGDVQWRSEGLS